jgi:hypothetical protein
MTDVLAPKNGKKRRLFYCEICDFECSKQSDYNRHLLTAKHKNTYNLVKKLTHDLQKNADPEPTGYTCECGKTYKHRQSLHSHRKKCQKVSECVECSTDTIVPAKLPAKTLDTDESVVCDGSVEAEDSGDVEDFLDLDEEKNVSDVSETSQMLLAVTECMKQIQKTQENQREMIDKLAENAGPKSITNNISNVNNVNVNYNVNVFLNDQCKNAVNLLDFVNNIQCRLEDLEYMGREGYVEGISKVLIDNLSEMEVTRRPIHCTDVKRKALYIKNNDEWHKDSNNTEMKNAIKRVAHKNRCNIKSWQEKYPEHHSKSGSNGKQKQYLDIIGEAFNTDEDDKAANKIIKNVGEIVSLDKSVIKDELS